MSALREWMAGVGMRQTVQVGSMGKLKTVFQMIATTLILLVAPAKVDGFNICDALGMSKILVYQLGMATLYTSTVFTLLSGWQYLRAAWPTLTAKYS